jgi:LysR family transcriptional regulator, positive regulator for ilvC
MDQHHLHLFLELADSLHFGRTSRKCNISPSALSRAIQRLEEEVGEPLFFRDNRSVVLTKAGTLFRDYAIEVLDGWDELKENLRIEGEPLTGELSLYCSVTACYSILPALMQEFRKAHPGIHIKLQTGDAASAVPRIINNEIDIVIAAKPDRLPRHLDFLPLTDTPLLFISPAIPCEVGTLTEAPRIPWEQVPMILAERGLARRRVETWFREQGIKPLIYAQVSGNEAILAMVRVGCGVGIVPGLVLEKSPIKTDIRVLSVEPALTPYSVGLVTQRRRLSSPLVSAFWNVAGKKTEIRFEGR